MQTWFARQTLVDGVVQPATLTERGGVLTEVTLGGDGAGADVTVDDAHVLLPGNVDSHVHVNEPGRTAWEGFASATEAAVRGGVTTLVDMPLNSVPSTVSPLALALKQGRARGKVRCDVGFWGGAVPDSLGRLEDLWDAGVYGFKCFLLDSGVPEFAPLDATQLAAAMSEIAAFDGLLIVHAEDPVRIAEAPARPSRAYADFVASRPDTAEVDAISTVIDAVREHGTRTHLLHLSSAHALDVIAKARDEGLPLTVETCPHYLTLDAGTVPDGDAAFKCCPPIRDRGNQDALWDALREGLIDAVVSDHSPSTLAEKERGDGDLQQAWGGIAGLQVSFPAVASAAAARGVSIAEVSAWMAPGPARVAGVSGKGQIAVGYDADLVVWDPDAVTVVRASELAHKNKLSAYDGAVLSGAVVRTVVRGETAFDRGCVRAAPHGQLLMRPSRS